MVDAGVDAGTEDMPLTGDFLLSSMMEGSFSASYIPMLDGFFYYSGAVVEDLGNDSNDFKSSKGIVNEEALGKAWVEGSEVIILSRD